MPMTVGVTEMLAVVALLNQFMVVALVFTDTLALVSPHTVAFTLDTVTGVWANMPAVVVTLHIPDVMVTGNVFKPNELAVAVVLLVVFPLNQLNAVPLVVTLTLAVPKPQTVVKLLVTVMGAMANIPAVVMALQPPADETVTV